MPLDWVCLTINEMCQLYRSLQNFSSKHLKKNINYQPDFGTVTVPSQYIIQMTTASVATVYTTDLRCGHPTTARRGAPHAPRPCGNRTISSNPPNPRTPPPSSSSWQYRLLYPPSCCSCTPPNVFRSRTPSTHSLLCHQ